MLHLQGKAFIYWEAQFGVQLQPWLVTFGYQHGLGEGHGGITMTVGYTIGGKYKS